MTAIEKYKNNNKKLEELELFVKIKGRTPSHSAKNRKDGAKPAELEHETLIGSWLNNKRFNNSDLDEKQLERLAVFLPKDKKRTPDEVCEEIIKFIKTEDRLPKKLKITEKTENVEKQETENRLSRWITTNKKKKFINISTDKREVLQLLLSNLIKKKAQTNLK